MKSGKWFSSQDATVKGAIIAAIATVAAAALTFAATVLVPFISAKIDNSNQASQQARPGQNLVTPVAITSSPSPSSSSPSSSSSPQQSDSPTRSSSYQAATEEAPRTQAPTRGSASVTPTATPPGPKSISGTYTFTRQVITCTYSSCTSVPFVLTLTCPAPASCAASWSPYGSHPATFDGTTIKVSFTALGGNCKGTALPTALTLDVTVASWTAGQGGAVRTPTQMQGTITASAPASSLGCPAAGDVETITYG